MARDYDATTPHLGDAVMRCGRRDAGDAVSGVASARTARAPQVFQCVGTEPVDRAGKRVVLVVIESRCPTCGALFEQRQERRLLGAKPLLRRCPRHRLRGRKVRRPMQLIDRGTLVPLRFKPVKR